MNLNDTATSITQFCKDLVDGTGSSGLDSLLPWLVVRIGLDLGSPVILFRFHDRPAKPAEIVGLNFSRYFGVAAEELYASALDVCLEAHLDADLIYLAFLWGVAEGAIVLVS